MKLDLRGAIRPDQGLAGLQLRCKISELESVLADLLFAEPKSYGLVTLYEASYRLANGAVEVVADVRNGKVARLTAHAGYCGELFGQIRVGMIAGEAMRIEPRLQYEEAEELILCKGVPGVAINVDATDPPVEAVPLLPIHSISVYAKEIESLAGQRGNW